MEATYTKNGWQQTTLKNWNYKPEGRRNIGRPQTRWENDFGEEGWPRSLSLIVDNEREMLDMNDAWKRKKMDSFGSEDHRTCVEGQYKGDLQNSIHADEET